MKPLASIFILVLMLTVNRAAGPADPRAARPVLIAHRGASAYAPEHTLAAYRLAIRQKADFVEFDLQMTKDGALICLHDAGLARTTNVAEVFPDRAALHDADGDGTVTRNWYAVDFTLAEISRLDAGSWFNRDHPYAASPEYAGQRIPSLAEAVRAVGGRSNLYIEIKYVPFYDSLGYDMVTKLVSALNELGFAKAKARSEKVIIQSFTKESLERLRHLAPQYRRVQLLPMEDAGRRQDTGQITPALIAEMRAYAHGVGPDKQMLRGQADVAALHAAGLLVHPYTFRGSTTAARRRPLHELEPNGLSLRQNILNEIRRYLDFGIDGGFTDYPDLWRQAAASTKR